MKASLVLLFLGLSAVIAYPAVEQEDILEGEWILVPDVNWNLRLVNVEEAEFEAALANRAETVVDFTLFTRKNPTQAQVVKVNDVESLRSSNFNPANPTRFITHGWNGGKNSQENIWIRDKYLNLGDYNIFVVDWSTGAKTINYIAASKNTKEAGKQVGNFIDFLSTQGGLNFDTLYLIGHSLGSHVVGYAGKYTTRGKINTIFGLDAALPLFSVKEPGKRLAKGDAIYVETIHTNGGVLGFDQPIGDSSFYPNWGSNQPGCNDLTGGCSHTRSCQYFAESLDAVDEFIAEQCGDYHDIEFKSCNPTGKIAKMGGEPSNQGRNVNGEYYLPTRDNQPFALGSKWIKDN